MKAENQPNGMPFVVPIAMTVFTLAFVAIGWTIYDYDEIVLRFPVLVAVVMLILCIGICVGAWRRRSKVIELEDVQPTVSAVAWVGAAVPAVLVFGFGCGLPLYTILYLKMRRVSWPMSLTIAATIFTVVVVFRYGLGVSLPLWPVFMR